MTGRIFAYAGLEILDPDDESRGYRLKRDVSLDEFMFPGSDDFEPIGDAAPPVRGQMIPPYLLLELWGRRNRAEASEV